MDDMDIILAGRGLGVEDFGKRAVVAAEQDQNKRERAQGVGKG